jgi:hypothetical protein
MDAIPEADARARGPFAVGAFRNEHVYGPAREGPDANGQMLMPKQDDGAIRQARVGRPTQA